MINAELTDISNDIRERIDLAKMFSFTKEDRNELASLQARRTDLRAELRLLKEKKPKVNPIADEFFASFSAASLPVMKVPPVMKLTMESSKAATLHNDTSTPVTIIGANAADPECTPVTTSQAGTNAGPALGHCGIQGCQYPNLELRDGHKCERFAMCGKYVHAICAQNNVPALCADSILYCSVTCKELSAEV